MDIDKQIQKYEDLDLGKQIDELPLGNSRCQILMEINKHETNGRKLRHVLLQMRTKYIDLKKGAFNRDRIKSEINRIKSKLFKSELDRIDLKEKEFDLKTEETLIIDAVHELDIFSTELEKLKSMTRDEFEAEEDTYWKARLLGDARREWIEGKTMGVGTQQALESLGLGIARINKDGTEVINIYDKKEISNDSNRTQEEQERPGEDEEKIPQACGDDNSRNA